MFKKGESVTVSKLLSVFKTIKMRLNEVANIQVKGISVGQIIGIGKETEEKGATDVVNTIMATTTEQYFDSTENIVYYLPEDSIVYGGEKWLDYWFEEIRKLEEL